MPIILSTITVSLLVAFFMYKAIRLSSNITTLIGVGSSICGGSAIAAAAPVIDAKDEEIATSISVIFLFNVAAALIFPSLGGLLGLSDQGFGLFAGTAVNDTSSVTAAAAWDESMGAHLGAGRSSSHKNPGHVPIVLAGGLPFLKRTDVERGSVSETPCRPSSSTSSWLRSSPHSSLPPAIVLLKNLSKFFIVMAMSAIGLNTDLVKLAEREAHPFGLLLLTPLKKTLKIVIDFFFDT